MFLHIAYRGGGGILVRGYIYCESTVQRNAEQSLNLVNSCFVKFLEHLSQLSHLTADNFLLI